MKKLKWLEITLDNERRQHHQSKATVAVLEERLAESQAWTARMSTYLKMERERGDTYKRLFEDRRGVEEELQNEKRMRRSYQQERESISRSNDAGRRGDASSDARC